VTGEAGTGEARAEKGRTGKAHADPARLFNIAPGTSFLPELIRAILDDRLGLGLSAADPLGLARATIYLPTRRSVGLLSRHLSEGVAARTGRKAALLPRILPLGGLDEAEMDLASGDWRQESEAGSESFVDPPLPPAIDPLRRKLLLARQIVAWGRAINRACFKLDEAAARLVPDGIGEAAELATQLADLIDSMHASDVPFERLKTLDAARFDQLWNFTLGFLRIAGESWPGILAAEGALDPTDRRNRLIEAECQRISAGRIEGPVIAAGSTGSVSATAHLLRAIATSPRGAVVLPGLDPHLDEEGWKALLATPEKGGLEKGGPDHGISHPQAVMARLVAFMGLTRANIISLGEGPSARHDRARLVSDALRPAATTHRWREAPFPEAEALAGLADVAILEAQDEREEAAAIALALREALEHPTAQAALVTPDRGLAQRVAIELARWSIETEDSAGCSLARTPSGHLAILALAATEPDASPITLAEFTTHCLLRLGLTPEERARAASVLEIAVLRGGMAGPGLSGMLRGLGAAAIRRSEKYASPPLKRISDEDIALARRFADALALALKPLTDLAGRPGLDFGQVALAHRQTLEALTQDRSDPKVEALPVAFTGKDGGRLDTLLATLAEQSAQLMKGPLEEYADLCRTLIAGERVAPAQRPHARVSILGLLEARLIDHDLVILGGLNEDVWPPGQPNDPFLNRPMRQELGLPLPERRIGQSAHDFSQLLLGSDRVVLSRAAKAGLTQTVPSRLWQRLQAVTPEAAWKAAMARGEEKLALARHISQPATSQLAKRPEPVVEARLQPTRLSVTEIETLERDPYAVYARRILKLSPIDEFAAEIGARERGTLFHDILARFAQEYPAGLPDRPRARLIEIAEAAFADFADQPEVVAFWRPRFAKLAGSLVEWEAERRKLMGRLAAEIDGRCDIALPGVGTVTLTARADRIETGRDGAVTIVDFKTGDAPSGPMIDKGLSLQLTLQSVIAEMGGFADVPAQWPANAAYVSLKPAADGKLKVTEKGGDDLVALSLDHLDGMKRRLAAFRAGRRGFTSQALPHKRLDAGEYDELARVKEWSRGGDEDNGGGET
jgi:ATP-dependent helicase/nuclease subunit B